MFNLFKREFTIVKLLFLFLIIIGIVTDMIFHKANGISVSCYIIGITGFFCPASLLRRF